MKVLENWTLDLKGRKLRMKLPQMHHRPLSSVSRWVLNATSDPAGPGDHLRPLKRLVFLLSLFGQLRPGSHPCPPTVRHCHFSRDLHLRLGHPETTQVIYLPWL